MKKAGWPEEHAGDFIYVTSMTGYELFCQRFTSYAKQSDLGYTPDGPRQCRQIFFDPILLRRAASLPSVTLRHRTQLDSFDENWAGVRARLTCLESGASETVMADYLIGCDGFDGPVRKALKVEYGGSEILSYSVSSRTETLLFCIWRAECSAWCFSRCLMGKRISAVIGSDGASQAARLPVMTHFGRQLQPFSKSPSKQILRCAQNDT